MMPLNDVQLAFSVNTSFAFLSVLTCLFFRWCLLRENKRMDKLDEDNRSNEDEEDRAKRIRFVL